MKWRFENSAPINSSAKLTVVPRHPTSTCSTKTRFHDETRWKSKEENGREVSLEEFQRGDRLHMREISNREFSSFRNMLIVPIKSKFSNDNHSIAALYFTTPGTAYRGT